MGDEGPNNPIPDFEYKDADIIQISRKKYHEMKEMIDQLQSIIAE